MAQVRCEGLRQDLPPGGSHRARFILRGAGRRRAIIHFAEEIMPEEHTDTATQAVDEAAPESREQESKPRRKRRRSRSSGPSTPTNEQKDLAEAAEGDADAASPGGENGSDDSGGGKKRRRRGGRGRSRRGKGGEEQASPEKASQDPPDAADREEELPDEDAVSKRKEKKPAKKSVSSKAAEVFADVAFDDLGLRNSVLKGVREMGFERTTFIQSRLIPPVLEGRDVLGQAKTGSGKTAAFGLPLFHMARRNLEFQTIVLCPTRELAIQIANDLTDFGKYTPIRVAAVYGGQPIAVQEKKLRQGPEIIVATPGRLMDLRERRMLHFDNVRFAVLDEVDRMLDIGFRDDIRKILKAIKTDHQTVFVSATISDEIESLARTFMREDAEKIVAAGGSLTVEMVEQHHLPVKRWDKKPLMLHLLRHEEPALTVVFCRTKRMVDNLTKYLKDKGIDAHAIHGDMHQGKRNQVMSRLRKGELGVLVASDLAARGLDVQDISHVVNYDLPEDPEIYIHRIGRTARAGREGVAWSLVTPEEGHLLTAVEKLANVEIPEMEYPDFKPGPEPTDVRREREQKAARMEQSTTRSRFARPEPPSAAPAVSGQDPRFPQGVVPTKFPPKKMGGRVSTGRGIKQQQTAADATEADASGKIKGDSGSSD